MAKIPFVAAYSFGAGPTTANTTQHFFHGSGSGIWPISDESAIQTLHRSPGTFSGLTISVSANTVNATSTFRLRKNLADGNQVISVGANATGHFTDSTNTDTIAAGDKTTVSFTPGAATGGVTITSVGTNFAATTDTVTRMQTYDVQVINYNGASTTYFFALGGSNPGTAPTTEAAWKCRQRRIGTFKNLALLVAANPRTTSTTFRLRKNGANGNQSITIGAGASGWFEDTSNTDTVAIGDDVNYSLTTGTGTENMTVWSMCVDWVSTENRGQIIGSSRAVLTVTEPATRFAAPGQNDPNITADVPIRAMDAYTFTDLTCLVTANSVNATSTFTFRKNGADTAMIANITTTGTGIFTDNTNTVAMTATDTWCYEITAPSVTGTRAVSIATMSIWVTGIVSGNAITRALATETVSISESVSRTVGKKRVLPTETVAISETRARLTQKNRAIATQTVAISENLVRVKGKPRALATETVAISETRARQTAKIRTISETVPVSETRARLAAKNRSLPTETVSVSGGTLSRIKGAIRALAIQTVAISETRARLVNKIRTKQETVTVNESLSRLTQKSRPLPTETVTVGGGILSRVKGAIRVIPVQTVSIGESISRLAAKNRALPIQTVTVSVGNASRLAAKMRALASEVVGVTDSLARVVEHPGSGITRSLTETVPISEAVTRTKAAARALNDSVAISENLARVKGKTKALSETVPITEQLARSKQAIRTIIQTVSIGSIVSRAAGKIRSLSTETVAITENVSRTLQTGQKNITRALSETVPISESLTRMAGKVRALPVEVVQITEELIHDRLPVSLGGGGTGGGPSITRPLTAIRQIPKKLTPTRTRRPIGFTVIFVKTRVMVIVPVLILHTKKKMKIKLMKMPIMVRYASLPVMDTPIPQRRIFIAGKSYGVLKGGSLLIPTKATFKAKKLNVAVNISDIAKWTKLERLIKLFKMYSTMD
jgi:hypothetical protein